MHKQDDPQNHGGHHHHHHTETKAIINRISRLTGHLNSIKVMVEDGRDCAEVLTQLAAVRSALNNVSKLILRDHMSHCIVDAVESGDQEALDDLNKALDLFIR